MNWRGWERRGIRDGRESQGGEVKGESGSVNDVGVEVIA